MCYQVDGLPLLPPVLADARACSYCFQASECMSLHAALEGGSAGSSGAPDLFGFALRDVSQLHLDYLRHWESMIDHEEEAGRRRGAPHFWALDEPSLEAAVGQGNASTVETKSNQPVYWKFKSCIPRIGGESDGYIITLECLVPLPDDERLTGMALTDRVMLSLEKVEADGPKAQQRSSTSSSSSSRQTQQALSARVPDIEDLYNGLTQVNVAEPIAVPVSKARAGYSYAYEPRVAFGSVSALVYSGRTWLAEVQVTEHPRRLIE